jgi:hypothetical protein
MTNMPVVSSYRRLFFVGLGSAAVFAWFLCGGGSGTTVAQPQGKDAWKDAKYLGVGACKDCHTRPSPERKGSLEFVLLTEYTTWRCLDKHSQAYAVLLGPRGQQMGKLLGVDVTKESAGCLNCHSMSVPKEQQGDLFNHQDGVGCDACHGPSSQWLGPHINRDWRRKTPAEKHALGMRDVRNPVTRATLCMSCHVGNVEEGKVVTHAMFAAGHPPLPPFEAEIFSKKMPQHWRDAKDVPYFKNPPKELQDEVRKNYDLDAAEFGQTKLVLASSLVAFRETMRLAAGRADVNAAGDLERRWPELALTEFGLSKNPQERWPEIAMAQADCYACHHDLQAPGWKGWRQARSFGLRLPGGQTLTSVAGRPQVRPWPVTLFDLSLRHTAKAPAEGDKQAGELVGLLRALYNVNNAQPFGDPKGVREAAQALAEWSNQQSEGHIQGVDLNREAALALLHGLCNLPAAEFADYETARQIASAFKVIYNEWDPQRKQVPGIAGLLDKLGTDLHMLPYTGRGERLALLQKDFAKRAGRPVPGGKVLLDYLERSADQPLQQALRPKEIEALQPFLNVLQSGISDEELAKLLLNEELKKKLYEIGNTDLRNTTQAIANFDPAAFKRTLEELEKLLPPK